jgi:hypothetical protein
VAWTLGQKDGLHLGFKEVKIQRFRRSGRSRLLTQQARQQSPTKDEG